jgi:HSP20 family protein
MVARSWNPWNEMVTLREAMNQLLEGSVVRPGTAVFGTSGGANTLTFPINVYGTTDELKVEALLPGVSPEDVQVDVDRGVLTIAAKRHGWEPDTGQNWYAREISSGQFTRSLSLPFPVEVEHATADFTNGVLTLTLPKAEAAKPKRIQIGSGQAHQQIESTAQQ